MSVNNVSKVDKWIKCAWFVFVNRNVWYLCLYFNPFTAKGKIAITGEILDLVARPVNSTGMWWYGCSDRPIESVKMLSVGGEVKAKVWYE